MIVALQDADNFYVSVERAFDPSLKGIPVLVSSNNDGCAVARSSEAKALGIKMGDPLHLIQDKIKRHGIVVRSSNYTLYGDMQRRILAAIEPFARDVEIYSIDENFVDLAGFEDRDLVAHCQAMRARVLQWTTIPSRIGCRAGQQLLHPLPVGRDSGLEARLRIAWRSPFLRRKFLRPSGASEQARKCEADRTTLGYRRPG